MTEQEFYRDHSMFDHDQPPEQILTRDVNLHSAFFVIIDQNWDALEQDAISKRFELAAKLLARLEPDERLKLISTAWDRCE